MMSKRTPIAALLATLTLIVLLGSWFQSGWSRATSEADMLRAAPGAEAQRELSKLGMELTGRLDRLRRSEDSRPYYHYQNLFHDPRGLSDGKSVSPSPLAESTGDVLIAAHFQVDTSGVLSIPPINEELEGLSQQAQLSDNQFRLVALRDAQKQLAPTSTHLAIRANEPKRQAQTPIQQKSFRNQAFLQNVAPNQVFLELEQQQQPEPEQPEPEQSPSPSQQQISASNLTGNESNQPIEVSTHGFLWKSAVISGRDVLVALRRVETPAGNLNQGFVIDADKISEWLKQRSNDRSLLSLQHEAPGDAAIHSISLPAFSGWYLAADISEGQALASAEADALRSEFIWRFGPTAAVSILLLVSLVLVVARSEKLAQERSKFAAAAAHELRTPLAGLQLYGDMLADGLGDTSAKEKYARHIADEAQRLGRVVSNVLEFSNMEQNGLQLRPVQGNLSEVVRRVVERMRHTMELAGMEVEVIALDSIEATFDDDAVYRILQNLMDNAEKYSRETGEEDRRMRIEVEKDGQVVRVSVSDTGPGVLRQMRQQIFKPFRRNDNEDSPAGLGLGLALARSLARQQGGDLVVRDSVDSGIGGARFVLELPRG